MQVAEQITKLYTVFNFPIDFFIEDKDNDIKKLIQLPMIYLYDMKCIHYD